MSIYDLVQVSLANLDQVLADLTDLADLLQHTHKKKLCSELVRWSVGWLVALI